ncbi:Na+/H+ antiporter family protein [Endozoicomonas sp. 8E]|uniref:Na+/H+ antiporter family protein n=1 Tax=Endozoicomonas sp. 8E TaxID=3035692 RepID=UPI002938DFF9|nr:Na+/H+ antiporter NhaC family protein [Endozoicomonas sp. 8E]WOG28370.1 Na+/H+ antiporter NhaC family protein [Endozoicomonas sp. 8E]
MNAVILAVAVMLALSLLRVNVVLALFVGALAGGMIGGLDIFQTLEAFSRGLGGGVGIAISYAMLGAFAVAIARSGIPEWMAGKIIRKVKSSSNSHNNVKLKYSLFLALVLMAFASQNLIPIHIAFIPILIPPLLSVFSAMAIDRRQVVCLLTFGLTATYMIFPVGFGSVYLNQILGGNLQENGLDIELSQMPLAMAIPVLGMFMGLLLAVFFSYRKSRTYRVEETILIHEQDVQLSKPAIITSVIAIVLVLVSQLITGSMVLAAALGFITMVIGGVVCWREADEVFNEGLRMMAAFGFIMISAAGFAEVLRSTGDIPELVSQVQMFVGGSQALAAILMLLVGLLITMGIGSSFSTVPIIATLYVPLGMELGFTPLAIACLVGVAGALGDAGSPVSESTIGPTAGLNVDGQHDHIRDSVIPTFLHFNIPMIIFGWIAAMIL